MLKRPNVVKFRLTDKELKQLNQDVKKTGLSREAYLRLITKKIQPKELPSVDFHGVMKVLQQICNNMNQIAAKANTIGFVDNNAYWENVHELQKAIGALMEKAYG